MGHFHTWVISAFAINFISLFFIQQKNKWAFLTQIFNTVAISAFLVAVTLIKEYKLGDDFFLSVENRRILLFATAAHFIIQYFLFFKRHKFSPWWSYFGINSLWGLFVLMAAQNFILFIAAYLIMVLSTFILLVRSSESGFSFVYFLYSKYLLSLFLASLSLIFFVLGTGGTTFASSAIIHKGLVELSLVLFFIVIIIESEIIKWKENLPLLQRWEENYGQYFYVQYIIKPSIIWCLLSRLKLMTNSFQMERQFDIVLTGFLVLYLIYFIYHAYKSIDFFEHIANLIKLNFLIILSYLFVPFPYFKNDVLAFSLLSLSTASVALLCLICKRDLNGDAFVGLYFKNKIYVLTVLYFLGSLLGLPLTSTFFFRFSAMATAWQYSLGFFILQLICACLLIWQFVLVIKMVFNKRKETFIVFKMDTFRIVLVGFLFVTTFYGGFWSFMRF